MTKRDLTSFESELLKAVFNQHRDNYRLTQEAIATLRVKDVETTGVGAYVTFHRQNPALFEESISAQLGYDGNINVPGVPSGLGCVIDITDGLIRHIELFTYGDEKWNGDTRIENFELRTSP